jgi:N-acetylmuramoyl-L-alanine amidase
VIYKVKDHKIVGDKVDQIPCQGKDSGLFTAGLPDTLVIHFTGGSSLDSSVAHLKAPDIKASAHLVIGRNGEVKQLIEFDRVAWHAGVSEWKGRRGLNKYSVGIELDNAGRMTRAGQSFVSWFGRQYPADEVIEAKHRNESSASYWHTYSEEQLAACFSVCRCLANAYPISTIVGHEEIAPGRKIDPGPAFPLERLRDQVLIGRADAAAESSVQPEHAGTPLKAVVNAERLNIRQMPYVGAALAGNPLPNGTEVEILDRSEKWCKVSVKRQGWVHGDFLNIQS